ncbi:hypothetical protein PROPHIGD05-3_18 [Mycobacterium phage prophiGD05-3]|nr:hypothetical protein PROPHIGD05-3_18 [Mycobacterium phage prophiGD05-3]
MYHLPVPDCRSLRRFHTAGECRRFAIWDRVWAHIWPVLLTMPAFLPIAFYVLVIGR